jgi:hypothetical protein
MIAYKCPLCSKVLSPDGDLLKCPMDHYRAPASKVSGRWERFDKEAEGILLSSPEGFDLARALLSDLQDMNIRKIAL